MKQYAKINNLGNPVERILIKVLEEAVALVHGSENGNRSQRDLLLGQAGGLYRPKQKENIYLTPEERLHHTYILGATGSGKSRLLECLIRQDILSERGFCVVDPHGDLIESLLNYLACLISTANNPSVAEKISQKLVLIDPTDEKWIVSFNPLEARDLNPYTQALEFMGIFKKLWSDSHWGPRTEELLRSTLVTLANNGLTLIDAKALLVNFSFREPMVSALPSGEVKEYWLYRYDRLSEKMQAAYREPILNRLSIFISDPSIRAMVERAKSTIDFRRIMDQGQWLLVNLSKGRLKSNAHLLGAFIIAKLQLAALSRVDMPEGERPLFCLYVDEFQNFLNEDFETIMSEARKYGLGLTLAHQNLDQLDRQLRSAILGNALTQVFFRLGHQDAALLAAEFGQKEKSIIQRRLVELKTREAYFKKKGELARRMTTFYVPRSKSMPEVMRVLKDLSLSRYARLRREVELEIANQAIFAYNKEQAPGSPTIHNDPHKGRFAPSAICEEGHDW